MKLSGRETTLILAMLIVLLLLGYYLFLLKPAQNKLAERDAELYSIKQDRSQKDKVIEDEKLLADEIVTIETDIIEIESSLLPSIVPEVVTQKLQAAFEDNGIPFIIECSAEPIVTDQILLSDGNYSYNTLSSVIFTISASGSDGIAPTILDVDADGNWSRATLVGYDEFILAVKDIEDDNPGSVKIRSISLEDSGQGFSTYTATIEVFAFSLPDRISTADMSQEYMIWEGTDLDNLRTDGEIGIAIEDIPLSLFDIDFYRPFSVYPTAFIPEYLLIEAAVNELSAQDSSLKEELANLMPTS